MPIYHTQVPALSAFSQSFCAIGPTSHHGCAGRRGDRDRPCCFLYRVQAHLVRPWQSVIEKLHQRHHRQYHHDVMMVPTEQTCSLLLLLIRYSFFIASSTANILKSQDIPKSRSFRPIPRHRPISTIGKPILSTSCETWVCRQQPCSAWNLPLHKPIHQP